MRVVPSCRSLVLLRRSPAVDAARGLAQLPPNCKPPASASHPPAGTPPSKVYDAIGVWFAQKGDLKCSVAAFEQALRLEPRSAEAHFDLGLVRQRQEQTDAAIREFRLALQYDPGLLQARCALGSALTDPAERGSRVSQGARSNPQLGLRIGRAGPGSAERRTI